MLSKTKVCAGLFLFSMIPTSHVHADGARVQLKWAREWIRGGEDGVIVSVERGRIRSLVTLEEQSVLWIEISRPDGDNLRFALPATVSSAEGFSQRELKRFLLDSGYAVPFGMNPLNLGVSQITTSRFTRTAIWT